MLQKHTFVLYIRHFTQQLVGCCPLSLRKKPVYWSYFLRVICAFPVNNMVKTKKNVPVEERRTSIRLEKKMKSAPVEKKKTVPKKAPKAKKPKAENGSNKAEEPKTEATDAK